MRKWLVDVLGYLFELLFVFGWRKHGSGGVLQPLTGLRVEGKARGRRWECVLHQGRRDVDGVWWNGHTFAPTQFHLKVHDHLSCNDSRENVATTAIRIASLTGDHELIKCQEIQLCTI